jgi:hypothetical protein
MIGQAGVGQQLAELALVAAVLVLLRTAREMVERLPTREVVSFQFLPPISGSACVSLAQSAFVAAKESA